MSTDTTGICSNHLSHYFVLSLLFYTHRCSVCYLYLTRPGVLPQGNLFCIKQAYHHDSGCLKQKEPKKLSRSTYNYRYTHQGWLTEDHAYFIFNDKGEWTKEQRKDPDICVGREKIKKTCHGGSTFWPHGHNQPQTVRYQGAGLSDYFLGGPQCTQDQRHLQSKIYWRWIFWHVLKER